MSKAPDKRALVKLGPDGIYFARPYLGTDKVTKRPIRPYRRFPEAADEEQAQAMADAWFADVAPYASTGIAPKLSSALWRWLATYQVRESAPPSTVATYASVIRCYLVPTIGDMDPQDVLPSTIDGLYVYLMLQGASRHDGGIKASTVAKVHWVLSAAFRWMAKERIVPMSPMASVERPKVLPREAAFLIEARFAAIAGALSEALSVPDASPEAIFRRNAAMAAESALGCGVRCGEACALYRCDMELSRQVMHVGHTAREVKGKGVVRAETTKTRKSRNVALYDDYVAAVRAHYAWQAGYLGERGDYDEATPLCCDAEGRMLRPSRVSAWFTALCRELGLPKGVTFHTLRHTHATWLLMHGEDLRTVMERLGDSSAAVVLGIYSHVLPGRDAEAAERFGAIRRRMGGAS